LKNRRIVWTKKATDSLDFFCEYISKDSPSAAKRVKREIVFSARQLAKHAEIYQLDELYGSPELNVRRFFRWNYRIVYQVFDKEVVVLDVYHTRSGSVEK
jgi:plasmid stabilization system protein ParE